MFSFCSVGSYLESRLFSAKDYSERTVLCLDCKFEEQQRLLAG